MGETVNVSESIRALSIHPLTTFAAILAANEGNCESGMGPLPQRFKRANLNWQSQGEPCTDLAQPGKAICARP